jgi:hypothetical protein
MNDFFQASMLEMSGTLSDWTWTCETTAGGGSCASSAAASRKANAAMGTSGDDPLRIQVPAT